MWKDVEYLEVADGNWFTRYKHGGSANWHVHESYVDLVAVWYLQAEKGSGTFVYRYDNKNYPIEVSTGDLLLFPGTLNHSTLPNTLDVDKIVMTTDICLTRKSVEQLKKLDRYNKEQVDNLYKQRQEQLFEKIKEHNEINIT